MKLTQHKSEVDSEGRKVLRFTPDEWETLSKGVTLLKDIYEHLDGGAAIYPGSLIFEEDHHAVAVIGTFLRKVEEIPARP